MRLGLALGKSLAEVRALSADEFMAWAEYDAIEPLPSPWLQTGVVAATVANAFRGKGPRAKPADFVPRRRRRKTQPQPARAMMAALSHLVVEEQ